MLKERDGAREHASTLPMPNFWDFLNMRKMLAGLDRSFKVHIKWAISLCFFDDAVSAKGRETLAD